jgi:hypothetical protein
LELHHHYKQVVSDILPPTWTIDTCVLVFGVGYSARRAALRLVDWSPLPDIQFEEETM